MGMKEDSMSRDLGILITAIGLLLVPARGTARGQTLLTQTTWGGAGSDVADAIATAPDGSSYIVGMTDSFATDQFGTPSNRIFLVKFAADGSLAWQRIWNGTTVSGLGLRRFGVAFGAGAVYVTGVSTNNQNDAVLLKFDPNGALIWERTWGGAASDAAFDVAVDVDGSAYTVGTTDSFGASSFGLFVVKFDSAGNLLWQKVFDGAEGDAVAVGPDGSVYAAGTIARDQLGNFDLLALKITSTGDLVWQRTYAAGNQADPRGGMTVAPDGSVVIAGAFMIPKAGIVPLSALVIKLSADGNLVFDKQFAGRNSEAAAGVAVAPDDGTIYVSGTTTSFGAGFEDAFVLHLLPTGKKLLDAVTWGSANFEVGAGVGVSGTTLALAASTNGPPPYSLLPAAAKLLSPRGTLSISSGTFGVVAGVAANPAAGAATPNGTTTFGGNFEAALVRIAR